MIDLAQNIWEANVDCICITTNGTILPNGRNIMGGGIAQEARFAVPNIDLTHGNLITKYGHRFQFLDVWRRPADLRLISLFAFPSKKTIDVNSDLNTIEESLSQLTVVANSFPTMKFGLPRPGVNLGGLTWEGQVSDLVEEYLVDTHNIIVFHYAQIGANRSND